MRVLRQVDELQTPIGEEVMLVEDPAQAIDKAELKHALERQIAQWTGRRVRQLRVELTDDRLILHGRTGSYYVNQLALAAVRDMLPTIPIDLDVEVVKVGGSQSMHGQALHD